MVEVSRLTKYYGDFRAIQDVSFAVQKGEILGFLGPNGAGKTTTLRILTGFMPPTEGTATVEGFDVFKDSYEVRRRIGYLPENLPLYHDMTVSGYLKFVGRIKGVGVSPIAYSVLHSLLFIGIVIILNFLNARHHHRWDLTEAGVFSLSPQSIKILAQLKQDLSIYAFLRGEKTPR